MALVLIPGWRRSTPDDGGPFVRASMRVRDNPPVTWAKYPGDWGAIIDMDYKELSAARVAGNTADYVENLVHLATACMEAYEHKSA